MTDSIRAHERRLILQREQPEVVLTQAIPLELSRVMHQGTKAVHWYNTQRLLEPIGNVAPVEYEMNYYRSQEGSLEMARLN